MKLIQLPLIDTLNESDFSTNNQNTTSLGDAAGEAQERDAALYSLDVHVDGSRIACGGRLADATGVILIWRMPDISSIFSFVNGVKGEGHGAHTASESQIQPIAQNGDGNLASSENRNAGPILLSRLCHQLRCVNAVRWSNHGQFLAAGSDDRSVFIYHLTPVNSSTRASLANGKVHGESKLSEHWYVYKSLSAHSGDVLGLAWSPTDRYLASCSVDNQIVLYDVFKQFAFRSFQAHTSFVRSIAFDPVNKYLVSQSDDRSVKIWQYTTSASYNSISTGGQPDVQITSEATVDKPFAATQPHDLPFLRLAWSTCGAFVVAPNSRNGKIPAAQLIYRKPKSSAAKLSVSDDKSVHGWNTSTDLIAASSPIAVCRFSPRLYVCRIDASRNRTLSTDADTNLPAVTKPAKRAQPCSTFATATLDGTICIWQQSRVRPIVALERVSTSSISDLAWSPDGYTVFVSTVTGDVFCLSLTQEELGATLSHQQQRECMLTLYGSLNDDAGGGIGGMKNGFHNNSNSDSKNIAGRDDASSSSSESQPLWESVRAERERMLAAEANTNAAAATTKMTTNGDVNRTDGMANTSHATAPAPESVERDAKGRRRIKPNFIPPPKVVPFGAPLMDGVVSSVATLSMLASGAQNGADSISSSADDVQFLRPSLEWASLQKVKRGRYADPAASQNDAPTSIAERGAEQPTTNRNMVNEPAENAQKPADAEKKPANKRAKRGDALVGEGTRNKKSKPADNKLIAERAANQDKQHALSRVGGGSVTSQRTESGNSTTSAETVPLTAFLDPRLLQILNRVAAASGLGDAVTSSSTSDSFARNSHPSASLILTPHGQRDIVSVRFCRSSSQADVSDDVGSMLFQPSPAVAGSDVHQIGEIFCVNKQNLNTASVTADHQSNSSEHFGFLKPYISEIMQKNTTAQCVVAAAAADSNSTHHHRKTDCVWHFTLSSAAVDAVADDEFCAVFCRDSHLQLLCSRSGLQLRPAVALGGAALHKLTLSSDSSSKFKYVSVILCDGDVRIWQLSSTPTVCVRQTLRCSLRSLIETFSAVQDTDMPARKKWNVSTVRIERNGTPVVAFAELPYCAYVFDADMEGWLRIESPAQATTAGGVDTSSTLTALCSTHDMCTASALYSNMLATSSGAAANGSSSNSDPEKHLQFLETQMMLTQILHHQSPLLYQQALKQFLHVLVVRGDAIRVRALLDRILPTNVASSSWTGVNSAVASSQSLFGRKIAAAGAVSQPTAGRNVNGNVFMNGSCCSLSEDFVAKEILPILTGNVKLKPVFSELAGRLRLQANSQRTPSGIPPTAPVSNSRSPTRL